MIQRILAIWSLVPLPFLNLAWTSVSLQFTYYWSLAWRTEHYFATMWNECNCAVVWTFFGIAFLWDWNENWPFPVLWPNLPAYWVQHLTASSFRIWNSLAGIPSPPLALSIVMLPKAHLTSRSRMSDSRWVITPLWLSGSRRSCLYSSSVYSYYLFLISSASVMSIPFLSFIAANDIIFFFLWLSSIPLYYIHCIILYTHIIYIVHYIHCITHTHTHTHTHIYLHRDPESEPTF